MKAISLVQDQYGVNGTVPVFIGDDWAIRCILNTYQPQLLPDYAPDNLTGCSVTAYFPATGGGTISSIGTVTNAVAGAVTFSVPRSQTIQAQVSNQTSFYAVATLVDTTQITYQTLSADLEIDAQGFSS